MGMETTGPIQAAVSALGSDVVPVRVETKVQAAYVAVRARILDGRFEPGSTISQEALAASLGLSTTPLREALRWLEAEGLVSLKAHRDMVIAPLTRSELHELLALREQLDPYAACLATERLSAGEIEQILHLASGSTPLSPREQLAANRRFHRAIYAASGNSLLTQALDSLWDRTDRYRLVVLHEQRLTAAVEKEHRDIALAIQGRNARKVAALVRKHVRSARKWTDRFSA